MDSITKNEIPVGQIFDREHQERARLLEDIRTKRMVGQGALFYDDVIDSLEQSEQRAA